MRIAKSVTLDIGMWESIEKISLREHTAVSRVIENLIARGINSKTEELSKALKELQEAHPEKE